MKLEIFIVYININFINSFIIFFKYLIYILLVLILVKFKILIISKLL